MTTSTSFDGLHTVEFVDGKRRYYKLDGERVPGATTVGACYPKGEGLIRWMIAQGLEEYDKKTKLKKAADIGKIVHEYAYAHMTKGVFNWGLVDGSDDADVVRECIHQYDQWAQQHPDDEPYMAEALVASPTLLVASHIDLVLCRDGHVIVRDYKTGKKIYVSALHQTVLYRRMLREWHDLHADALEILKFSKDPNIPKFEYLYVTNEGMDVNGTKYEYKGLLDELEKQTVRNVETFRHVSTVEKILNEHYKTHK
jgi:hypothetical protein